MGIFLRGKKWYVDVPDGKGRRIRRSVGPSKDVAELVQKDLQVKIAKKKYLGIFETATTPFSEYAKDWLAKRKPTLKPSTYRDYSSIMEVYVIPHFGGTAIGKALRRFPNATVTRSIADGFISSAWFSIRVLHISSS